MTLPPPIMKDIRLEISKSYPYFSKCEVEICFDHSNENLQRENFNVSDAIKKIRYETTKLSKNTNKRNLSSEEKAKYRYA